MAVAVISAIFVVYWLYVNTYCVWQFNVCLFRLLAKAYHRDPNGFSALMMKKEQNTQTLWVHSFLKACCKLLKVQGTKELCLILFVTGISTKPWAKLLCAQRETNQFGQQLPQSQMEN